MDESPRSELLTARGICKRYTGVQALDSVDLEVGIGEVVAVVGENGAGKSTLMKILAGVIHADAGRTTLAGREVEIDSVRAATAHGIALIHQELNLAENLDIGANVFLGREPHRLGFVDRKTIERESLRHLAALGLDLSPRTLVGALSPGHKQLVEIAKALSANARILIMDEPTSSLSQHESHRLFETIRKLSADGVSIVYISHRLGEVSLLADRVVVLRDGRNAGVLDRAQATHNAMVRLMVGREASQFYARTPHDPGAVVLAVKNLRTRSAPQHALTFNLRAGELVGLAGLVGAGRTELLETIFGVERPLAGSMSIDAKSVAFNSPADAIAAGVALAPEDRKQHGLILDMMVAENISLTSLGRLRRAGGFIDRRSESTEARRMIERLGIRTPTERQVTRFLSGGNQQKVVLARWLTHTPRVLLLDEPTRGVDVGAKQEIYQLMEQLAASGVAILFASSELEEILGMADRTLVMHEGRMMGELARSQMNEEAIMRLATGGRPQAA